MPSKFLIDYAEFSKTTTAGGGLMLEVAAFWEYLFNAQRGASVTGDLLELGVHHGYTAALLAHFISSEESLNIIDIFMNETDFCPQIERFSPQSQSSVRFWRKSSFDITRNGFGFDNRGDLHDLKALRFAHIDGEHSYEAVFNDYNLVINNLSDSGVIVFDDILHDICPQLTHALFDLLRLKRHEIVMFALGMNKAYLCRPRALRFYRNLVREAPNHVESISICASGWNVEMPYFGLTSRSRVGSKWVLMNRYTEDISEVP